MRRTGLAVALLFAGSLMAGVGADVRAHAAAEDVPRAVKQAQATAIPACTLHVDAAAKKGGTGSIDKPFAKIGAAVAAAEDGAVICVAEGRYREEIAAGGKAFTLAGGFQSGSGFQVRDSAKYVSKAEGGGEGSFLRIGGDEAPGKDKVTAVDGFDISGYSQAIVRDFWESQRFDVTNNVIHDNTCADASLAGAGVALVNVSGAIMGNVFRNNSCGRGGAMFLNDPLSENEIAIERNLIERNSGTEQDSAHGGAVYAFVNTLVIRGNAFLNNSVAQWGGGLFVGADTPRNQQTTATLSWNVYRGNRAGNSGGGFFCDDGATCNASHEVYAGNCGGNVLVDGGPGGSGPTTVRLDHVTNVGALDASCEAPGLGLLVANYEAVAADSYSVTNAIFWGNAEGGDFAVSCASGCGAIKVSVAHSMVQTAYSDGSVKIKFGPGIVAPADPLFVAPDKGDYRLEANSPALGKGAIP